MADNVIPLELTAQHAQRLIKSLARDSANVYFTEHAKKRMKQRHITNAQVLKCLSKGRITEGPYRDINSGNWRTRLEYHYAGNDIVSVAELFTTTNGEKILIITVF